MIYFRPDGAVAAKWPRSLVPSPWAACLSRGVKVRARVRATEDAPATGAANPLRDATRRLGDGALRARAAGAMNAQPHDHEGQPGIVYVLHL